MIRLIELAKQIAEYSVLILEAETLIPVEQLIA